MIPFFVVCTLLCVVQLVAALPWLVAVERSLRRRWRDLALWGKALGACAGAGLVASLLLHSTSDVKVMAGVGRVYASVLHLQLGADLFVGVFGLLLTVWPKGGAVALSAFREGVRQPMFWLLTIGALLLMAASPFFPYFTFGEDLKMVMELCFAFTMMFPAVFAVVAASLSVSEEIEGRTAVTLMSKPVSRRQFLLGKFAGILLASLFMTVLLGWCLVWLVLFAGVYLHMPYEPEIPDPAWIVRFSQSVFPESNLADLMRGMGLWLIDATSALPGLVIGFCQVMVFLSIAVALATRVPLVVNMGVCLAVYFLGHLTPIITAVAQQGYRLVLFVAQLFDLLLPGLELFDVGNAIVREAPLPPGEYALYTMNVALYAVIYTAVALLFGLILFEDRDLA
jgi:ABC-type transport system involved in multi-copper enzyme maturation permease subunit